MTELAQLSPPPFEYEAQLQSWLAENPDAIEPGLWIVGYEFPLGENRADLLAVDGDGRLVVIEVKRANATREAVGQVLDYVSALEEVDPTEIASTINTAEARPEFAPVDDFERQFAERYAAAAASGPDLMPVRAILAATSESPETDRILEYLQGIGMDIHSVVFKGALAEDGERTYQRRRAARPVDDDVVEAAPDMVDELGMREPCRASFPKAGKKGRLKIKQVHRRSEEYPDVKLFREVHCAIVRALPDAHELAREERDGRHGRLCCGIAFTMRATSADENERENPVKRGNPVEHVTVRLYPEDWPGKVRIQLFGRAMRCAGEHVSFLNRFPDFDSEGGRNRGKVDGCHFWFTEATWLPNRSQFETVLNAIHEGRKAEWEAGQR